MYECESWTIKNAEPRRTDAFELWCSRRLLRVPWTARRSKPVNPTGSQPWIFIGRTNAEAPVVWPPDAKSRLMEKTLIWERLKAKGKGGGRGWDSHTASPTQCTWISANSRRYWRTGKPGMLQSMRWQRVKHDLVTEQQQPFVYFCFCFYLYLLFTDGRYGEQDLVCLWCFQLCQPTSIENFISSYHYLPLPIFNLLS